MIFSTRLKQKYQAGNIVIFGSPKGIFPGPPYKQAGKFANLSLISPDSADKGSIRTRLKRNAFVKLSMIFSLIIFNSKAVSKIF